MLLQFYKVIVIGKIHVFHYVICSFVNPSVVYSGSVSVRAASVRSEGSRGHFSRLRCGSSGKMSGCDLDFSEWC